MLCSLVWSRVATGDIIFKKNATPKEMFFLLEGEVTVLSWLDDATPTLRLRETTQAVLSQEDHDTEVFTRPSLGCFGQSVLTGGARQHSTHKASKVCELLVIDKEHVLQLFKTDSLSAGRICNLLFVLRDEEHQRRLRNLVTILTIAMMPRSQTRSVFVMQRAWRKCAARMALKHDEIYRLIERARLTTRRKRQARAMHRGSSTENFEFSVDGEKDLGDDSDGAAGLAASGGVSVAGVVGLTERVVAVESALHALSATLGAKMDQLLAPK